MAAVIARVDNDHDNVLAALHVRKPPCEQFRGTEARTAGHAHRVLHRGLERAVKLEILSRNVAHAVPPPTVEPKETKILTAEQIGCVLQKLQGHSLHSIIAVAVNTGMRRG